MFPVSRGIFGGNRSVKFGLIAILACVLVLKFTNRGDRPLTGPIDDVFLRDPSGLLIVYGTDGESTAALRDYAHKVADLLGRSLDRDILVYPDREVDSGLIRDYSLLLYGPVESNRVTRRLAGTFPFEFSADTARIGDLTAFGQDWRLVFTVPNPRNDSRYLLVYTGPSDSSVVGVNLLGNPHFVRHDTTDYVLAESGRIVRSGYFVKDDPERWKLPGADK
ncbi:MAG: hypothetical protein FVQ81_04075 [Candidatus Glassbacteria bacterium]|nr:hypothetical protein [Candidatus Glassbacteria bacterium]